MIPKMLGTSVLKEKQDMDLNDMVSADSFGEGKDTQENPYMLSTLAPRLWPFMRHTITSVRLSAIRTLVSSRPSFMGTAFQLGLISLR